jgi:transposase-like protein
MKLNCPRCTSKNFVKNGIYYRQSDRREIKRYKCCNCKTTFSKAFFDLAFKQKKRQINNLVFKLLSSNVSQRRIALILNINRKTVARKLKFLGMKARLDHGKYLKLRDPIESFVFDDLETIEHTKCKPVSVTTAVEHKTRKILSFEVCRMPAKGHLARISRSKYGFRADERKKSIDKMLKNIVPYSASKCLIKTDKHNYYPEAIAINFPKAIHESYKSERGTINGQGELKKVRFDPIFDINHTFAMFRANINRLIRKSWCTTKKLSCLEDHIWIYVQYHNEILTK